MRVEKIPSCSVVIAAAGSSSRMNGTDKLFVNIPDSPVLAYTLAMFQISEYINEIVIVAREDKIDSVIDICRKYGINKASKVIIGGATRLESVSNGVFSVSRKAGLIAIHDGARPCIDLETIERTVKAAAKRHAAAPAIPLSSTVKRVKDDTIVETVDREGLYEVQTPQVFKTELIKAALIKARRQAVEITDDCMAVELIGVHPQIVEGSVCNIKLTTGDDLVIAEALLKRMTEDR